MIGIPEQRVLPTCHHSQVANTDYEALAMAKAHDLLGWRFGTLRVIGRYDNDPVGKTQWVCQCDCGGAHIARGDNLIMGRVTRCPQCPRMTPNHVKVDCWYHALPIAHPRTPGGVMSGIAGFATFSRAGQELAIQPAWFEGVVNKRRPPWVLSESVKRAGTLGVIQCKPDTTSVTAWINRHKADITFHSYNEGSHVWGEWHRRTGEWKGPIDTDMDLSELVGAQSD